MTEYDDSQDAPQTQRSRGATLGVDMIDVLIRNLEATKANFEGGEALAAEGTTFCTAFYADTSGHWCPLLYYHSGLAETEPAETAE
jgi:hypothetical protein